MRFCWILFGFIFSLHAQNASVSTLTAPIAYSGAAIFPIDLKNRGQDIVNMISVLSTGTLYNLNNAEIAVLTSRNGLIRFVTSANVIPTTNYTILIIGSLPSKGASISNLTFYVIPVEQIVEVVYSPYSSVSTSPAFNATVTSGVLPVYPVDLAQRATDLINVLAKIKANTNPNTNTKNYFRYLSTSSFAFQTSLFGPFPPVSNQQVRNGVIHNVQCVSLTPPTNSVCGGTTSFSSHSTLLFVTYNTGPNYLTNPYYLVASPDQIYGITYTP